MKHFDSTAVYKLYMAGILPPCTTDSHLFISPLCGSSCELLYIVPSPVYIYITTECSFVVSNKSRYTLKLMKLQCLWQFLHGHSGRIHYLQPYRHASNSHLPCICKLVRTYLLDNCAYLQPCMHASIPTDQGTEGVAFTLILRV